MPKSLGLLLCCVAMIASTARAHFIWVQVLPPAAKPAASVVQLSFGETPAPGEAHLVNKVQQTKVYPLSAAGRPKPSHWSSPSSSKMMSPRGKALCRQRISPDSKPFVITASLAKGGSPFWLNYYAKHLVHWLGEANRRLRAASTWPSKSCRRKPPRAWNSWCSGKASHCRMPR